ncbi:MAG: RNA polymerase sigma factor [Planctomycetota bacterium]|jgi:RNA polymerase sigma-70 factor (ECF subfamily)
MTGHQAVPRTDADFREVILLVEAARGGDRDAFGRLVEKYHRRAISLAYRLLGNREDARDVAQDAFVRAYRSLGQLEDPGKFGGWLLKVVSNLSLNYRRSRSARQAASVDDLAPFADELRNPATSNPRVAMPEDDDDVMPSELKSAIDAAVNKLPDQQRLALVLFSVERVPQKEVAEILGCTIEMVKWNVFQARKKLKEALSDFI